MHTTRRVKRPTRPRDDVESPSMYVRHRRATRPDAIRGAMLVALVVVTVVLYIILWELERSSFTSVPRPSMIAVSATGQQLNLSDDRVALPSAWPPPITHLLGEHVDENEFDTAHCNGACRFLLPVRIGEQESKARIHFTQLLVLARRLNRTIVLPNVGKSRMSACSKWPFHAYYDATEFAQGSDSRPAMDLERFTKWVDERPVVPTSLVVSLRRDPDVLASQTESEDVPLVLEKAELDPKILSCLDSKFARLRMSLPETTLSMSFHSDSLETVSDTSSRVVELLSNNLDMDMDTDFDLDFATGPGYEHTIQYINSSSMSLADVDILILDYDLRHPLFAGSINLHYAPVLYDLADRLADNLGPFLGVHWRMENVPVQNLAWCAASLVSTLHALLQDTITGKNVRHVWLATDHPRPLSTFMDGVRFSNGEQDASVLQNDGSLRKSSTFKALSTEHDDAIRVLAEAFQPGGDLDAWKLTDLPEQLHRYPYVEGSLSVNETLLGDSGITGILDKLVIVQAKVFVSGSTDCSKTSSFSKQVVEARKDTLEAERGKGAIRNVVEYFGKW